MLLCWLLKRSQQNDYQIIKKTPLSSTSPQVLFLSSAPNQVYWDQFEAIYAKVVFNWCKIDQRETNWYCYFSA
jgi:hypothetical protein